MRDPDLLEALERIYNVEARSFVRYLVESSRPWVRDEADRRALQALHAWHGDIIGSLTALEALLLSEKVHPAPPPWPIHFAEFSLLSPAYLLGIVIDRMEPHLERLAAERSGLLGWPEAEEALESCLARERAHLEEVRTLWSERDQLPPRPAVKKGVSANFW
jgi:hypothetical protein